MQEHRRNWTELWTRCRNTEETGQGFGQDAGTQKKLKMTITKNEL
jgi:hypothetical protein